MDSKDEKLLSPLRTSLTGLLLQRTVSDFGGRLDLSVYFESGIVPKWMIF